MQLLVKLRRISNANRLAVNYQYQLSACLESIFEQADFEKIQDFVDGLKLNTNHIPFTFSQFSFDQLEACSDQEYIHHTGELATLDVRILVGTNVSDYLSELLLGQRLSFTFGKETVEYCVNKVETIKPPSFKGEMTYSAITPLFLTNQFGGSGDQQVISPMDERYSEVFKTNLLKRFSRLFPELRGLKDVSNCCPEIEFKPVSHIEEKELVFNLFDLELIELKGFQFDFKLKASPILQEFGYYAGFGAQSSLGFGCVEVK
ncbi:CRISPR-associated endoribonuclease Cas6 [Belliella sp. DSM 111904]|uniref:CRISPR-associated endoribonuclease Cas6 n=1 Tax=Belliella filtrata TaxID=2923435 RepID=A0ABS9UWF1_9BACT|nr:CRISPR-associated endoribonuclease Cas6 [Belliella filtrata]MCH7408496.1 CRISPR-associated endoribonuclease Cas6 [Belliella filtrata]